MQAEPSNKLPPADTESRVHSGRVEAHIRHGIAAAGGSISFAEFMQEALFAPGLGYYMAGSKKFGADGDFTTAPEVSPLFGKVVARQCREVLLQTQQGDVLELGAGSAALALEVLTTLSALDALPRRYLILEVSPELRERQRQLLHEQLPDVATRVEWVQEMPASHTGVIVANEVADALPVERFTMVGDEVRQLRVAANDDELVWQAVPAPANLESAVRQVETDIGMTFPDGYTSEVSLALPHWIAAIASCLQHGTAFLFDYGVARHEYYAPDRAEGWLRCHFRHRAHDNPLINLGIQDLTSWIDFSAMANAAAHHGMRIEGFTSQSQFLLNGGLQDELTEFTDLHVAQQLELSRQIKILTLPGEMGENFKCLSFSHGAMQTPTAFSTGDRAHAL